MIAGNNGIAYANDFKYNATDEDFVSLAKIKKQIEISRRIARNNYQRNESPEEYNRMSGLEWIRENFESNFLPSLYNNASGVDTQSSFFRENSLDASYKKFVSDMIDIAGTHAKYKEGSIREKIISALESTFNEVEVQEPTKQDQKEVMKSMQKAIEKIEEDQKESEMRGDEPGEGKGEKSKNDDDHPLKDKPGYIQLQEWLKKIKTTAPKKRKYVQMRQISDIQRVSPVEFVKPRILFMKKLAGKEFYCRKIVETDRFMHTILDESGSMRTYTRWKNALMQDLFNDCKELNIIMENTYWSDQLNVDTKQILKEQTDLEKHVLKYEMDAGGTEMGPSTIQKLELIKKTSTKQYLLVVSDGDGSIRSMKESSKIYRLCSEKNVEIKFALFQNNSPTTGIRPEDVFKIY